MRDVFPDAVIALIPMMRGYAMSLTRSRSEADDLVQDTLVRAWRFRTAYEPGTNLKAWLYKILRNIFYSNHARRRLVVLDADGRLTAQLSCTPEQEWQVEFGDLLRSLDRLTPHPRRPAADRRRRAELRPGRRSLRLRDRHLEEPRQQGPRPPGRTARLRPARRAPPSRAPSRRPSGCE